MGTYSFASENLGLGSIAKKVCRKELTLTNKIAMTIEEASEYTGIGRNTLRLLVSERKIPVLQIGRKHIVRTDALDEFLKVNQGIDLRDIDKVRSVS